MSYIILITALLIEVLGTTLLKSSNGFQCIYTGSLAYICYGFSIYLFSISIKHINLAVADTIWQGLGIVLITLVSYFIFNESLNVNQIVFMIITLIGIIGIGLS